ncbi:BPSL0761 family protein [Halomonas smyrnensis]|uniref:BPSL0761 family protein n=1 Tax=Halomonas smyrnensis TaxID=720605 RepID=UPI0003648058|nr:BPSL0761 family protein [Halomonas smyrnensis]
MTTPAERTRTVIQARAFLIDIAQNLSLPESHRHEARRLLRHYPTQEDMRMAGQLEESAEEGTLFPTVFSSSTEVKQPGGDGRHSATVKA